MMSSLESDSDNFIYSRKAYLLLECSCRMTMLWWADGQVGKQEEKGKGWVRLMNSSLSGMADGCVDTGDPMNR